MKSTQGMYERSLDYFIFLLFILSSTLTTSTIGMSLVLPFILIIFLLIVSMNKQSILRPEMFFMLFVAIVFLVIHFVKFSDPNPLFTMRFLSRLLLAYLVIQYFRTTFFEYYTDITYKLAFISLPLWVFQILDFDLVFNMVNQIKGYIPFFGELNNRSANIIVWGLQNEIGSRIRNCGFLWEPGAFAAFLLLPIMYNIAKNSFRIEKRSLIMIMALITTLSTMGYLALGIIGVWYALNKNYGKIAYLSIIGLTATFMFLEVEFLGEKITDIYGQTDAIILNAYYGGAEFASLGRFGSAVMDLEDLANNPLFGIGGSDEQMTTSAVTRINRTNGLTNFLLIFGILGSVILFLNLIASGRVLIQAVNARYSMFYTIIVMVLAFSNTVLLTPLFLSVQLYYLVPKRNNV